MLVNRRVLWSPEAENDLSDILEYLEKNWSLTVVNRFLDLLDETILRLSDSPKLFPLVEADRQVIRCVLTKHNSIYYRFKEEQLHILRIYDTRQDPENLRFRISTDSD
ncbi:MAG: hypothetical protein GC178_06975 [Flavobacteriales bacterium]|nr:hypothetical protein [Flavobacteriales bacterium]